MGPMAIQMEVDIKLECPDEFFVMVDAEEMEIILNNLISNAVKYNKIGGTVICRLKAANKKLIIEIEDTGIGIPEDDIPTLFREFVRIRQKETKHIMGSGLGLSIVKRLIALYDGTIEVESHPGEGSIFRVVLPVII